MPHGTVRPSPGSGRGAPHEKRLWADAGYAHLVMDTHGRGAETPDPDPAGGDIAAPGLLTRGVPDPRRLPVPCPTSTAPPWPAGGMCRCCSRSA
ncbi:acetylxylan esterase [Streptomyces sp. NPDC051658]|uniref:acetylxylan esterase n=1 Tax=Streptomyces sp. NPDC051658 TaxID=3365667 RepID=UPI0037A97969